MSTKLIRLTDGTLVEVVMSSDEPTVISNRLADQVAASIDNITPVVERVATSVVAAWHQINQDMDVEHAEIELGLSFESEGNVYLARVGASANLNIKLTLKPRK